MNRREFCKSVLQLGAFTLASSLIPQRGWTSLIGAKPQFFILVRINGGWDTSLGTDPWTANQRPSEKDFFLEYRADELLPLGTGFVGPALSPLKKHFSRLAIVNGVFMSATDGGHDSATLYAESGNGQGHLGVLPLELEGRLFASPFGTLSSSPLYSGNNSRVIWDLNNLVNSKGLSNSDFLLNMQDQNTELAQARNSLISQGHRVELFNQILAKSSEVNQATCIASGFLSGLTSTAFLNIIEGNLDTHASHEKQHLTELQKDFTVVNTLMDTLQAAPGVDGNGNLLETANLLDQTTVMITSEFTRTPGLNASKGKDHNPQCNSVILVGPGIRSGIYGSSRLVESKVSKSGTSYLAALPLDLTTEMPSQQRQNSFILRPENVVASVAQSMGLNPAQISTELSAARLLKKMIK